MIFFNVIMGSLVCVLLIHSYAFGEAKAPPQLGPAKSYQVEVADEAKKCPKNGLESMAMSLPALIKSLEKAENESKFGVKLVAEKCRKCKSDIKCNDYSVASLEDDGTRNNLLLEHLSLIKTSIDSQLGDIRRLKSDLDKYGGKPQLKLTVYRRADLTEKEYIEVSDAIKAAKNALKSESEISKLVHECKNHHNGTQVTDRLNKAIPPGTDSDSDSTGSRSSSGSSSSDYSPSHSGVAH